MLKILFIGDISGNIGRKTVNAILPGLKKKLKPDLVIANAENIAHGTGVTEKTLKEVMEAGVDWFTCGDHSFKREKEFAVYDNLPILRPANYSEDTPGKGHAIITVNKYNILLINLIGRVFMDMDYDCPFRKLDEILTGKNMDKKKLPRTFLETENTNSKNSNNKAIPEQSLQQICKVWGISAIIVDIHAEATAEKIALGHYADGRISAMVGTHTHVMTADSKITKKGTAYISDAGMTGFSEGCIGVDKENIIKTFLTQIKNTHVIPETGKAIFNAVLITIDPKTRKATGIKPIIKTIEIK